MLCSWQQNLWLATVLLERNRWSESKQPSILVSHWLDAIADAGFSGIELWENHWWLASSEERDRIRASSVPVRVFNSYFSPAGDLPKTLQRLWSLHEALGTTLGGIKFNFSGPGGNLDSEIDWMLRLADALPSSMRFLCECHPGTLVETPWQAGRAARRLPSARFGFIAHPFLGEEGVFHEWLLRLGGRIEHLHGQSRSPDGALTCVNSEPDRVRGRLAVLASQGVSRSMCLEFTGGVGDAGERMEVVWANAVADRDFLETVRL